MGLTKRPDSYYVEFRVIDSEDAKVLSVGKWNTRSEEETLEGRSLNKTVAREMEAAIETRLLLGQEQASPPSRCYSKSGQRLTWSWKLLKCSVATRIESRSWHVSLCHSLVPRY